MLLVLNILLKNKLFDENFGILFKNLEAAHLTIAIGLKIIF